MRTISEPQSGQLGASACGLNVIGACVDARPVAKPMGWLAETAGAAAGIARLAVGAARRPPSADGVPLGSSRSTNPTAARCSPVRKRVPRKRKM